MFCGDLREYIDVLEKKKKLTRVTIEIDKDRELMPLVQWQFIGVAEEKRKAFLFEKIRDAKGNKYLSSVAVATHAASADIYSLAMGCNPDEINEKWMQAQLKPVTPLVIKEGPCQEEVHLEEDLSIEGHGLEEFPIPICTPGYDPAPFITGGCWVTKDPETGIRNVGIYRAQLKGRTKTGIQCGSSQHVSIHLAKARGMNHPLPAAVVIGGPPSVGLVSASKLPYGIDEFAVAGGIMESPLELVKCRTVDLEVPATAEIVLEGYLSTDYREPEGVFGEYTGYIGSRTLSPVFNISCISHRRNPIFHVFFGQYPPSESSKIRKMTFEANMYKFLKNDCNIPGIMKIALHEFSGSQSWCVIKLKKINYAQPWQALNCAAGFSPIVGKIIIAVDEDVDPEDTDAVIWALSFRMQPHLDLRVTPGKVPALDPSAAPPENQADESYLVSSRGTSCLLIDATRKWKYPPVALPKKEFMVRSKEIWQALGLAALEVRTPWHGYELGLWDKENEEEAQMALRGEHFRTGDKLADRGKRS